MSRERTEAELRDFARLQVRAGLLDDEARRREVGAAVAAELPDLDADVLARAWLAAAAADLARDQRGWPERTDVDRLEDAFAECEQHGVLVLRGVEDHGEVERALGGPPAGRAGDGVRGALWFTPPDVWHAVDHGLLEVTLWRADTANAAPGDRLLDAVLACLQRHGLQAHFDEGRIEVACRWQRRG